MTPIVFFITHPDVVIDRNVPVPDWPLSARGLARMRALTKRAWLGGVQSVFSSYERKARDGARIIVEALGLDGYSVVEALQENDRSATGFLDRDAFEAIADAFFAQPRVSVRGWETAADAQARIVRALDDVLARAPADHDVAIVGHGGTGTLLYCHLAGVPISRRHDQPPTTAETGWALIGPAASCFMTGHGRSTRRERAPAASVRTVKPVENWERDQQDEAGQRRNGDLICSSNLLRGIRPS